MAELAAKQARGGGCRLVPVCCGRSGRCPTEQATWALIMWAFCYRVG